MPITPILIPGSPIFIVGEAPGKSEEMMGKPFVGTSGQELDRMLSDAGIDRASCSISNVFLDRPKDNNLDNWLVSKKAGGQGVEYRKGKYFPAEKERERFRLYNEIDATAPNVVIGMGNTAAWALLGKTGINAVRGVVWQSAWVKPKIIPTLHPAAILRQYELRATAIMDLMKAKAESAFPEIRLPSLKIEIRPSLSDCLQAEQRLLAASLLSYDIETQAGQITCIGFAVEGFAICIPFTSSQGSSYWSLSDEVLILKLCKRILESPVRKVTQNGLYDIQYLHKYGIKPRQSLDDTMLLHHSIMPELPKSLGFIGSVYTNFPSWKNMRKTETNKKEE